MPEENVQELPPEKLNERGELLKLCCGMKAIQAIEYARKLGDEEFAQMLNSMLEGMLEKGMKKPATFPDNYYGKFYTIQHGKVFLGCNWVEIKKDILECLASDQGDRVKQVIEYLLDQKDFEANFTTFKAKFARFRNALDKLHGYGLIKKETVKDTTKYSLYKELVPLYREVIASEEVTSMPVVRSEAGQQEMNDVKKMEEEFNEYLKELVSDRLEETIEFGKKLNIEFIAEYLQDMFGPTLYFDHLLAIAHQYAMTDTPVVNPEGGSAFRTGFHLALFGAPGTGKTFAVKELMIGDLDKGVKGHGLVGLNRYCGGMTPANFIRIGEAYQGKRFNFVVTEFNDWFRYKGMVEPLKNALEQGLIRYETKHEQVGPYKFSSFFATNYNTKVTGRFDYTVTISDPNFNAIEDRMLVRLHRMTKERFKELAKSQKELAMGRIRMQYADQIRDHLVLVYAIQTEHELVKDKFKKKSIVLRDDTFKKLEEATNLILDTLKDQVRFSARVQRNALKLASAFTLPSFFAQDTNRLEITPQALDLALKFYVEEIAIRQKIEIEVDDVLNRLGISEIVRVIKKVKAVKEELQSLEEPVRADHFQERIDKELRFLKKEFKVEKGYEECEKNLKQIFGDKWSKLDKGSQQFLLTGEILLNIFNSLSLEKIDYSPVIVEYAKSLEQELIQKVFNKFQENLSEKGSGFDKNLYKVDWENLKVPSGEAKSFKRTCEVFEAFLDNRSEITLGIAWYILLMSSKPISAKCLLFEEFKSFLKELELSDFLLSEGFLSGLQQFNDQYRNKAAHLEPMTAEDSKKCREILLTSPPRLLFDFVQI